MFHLKTVAELMHCAKTLLEVFVAVSIQVRFPISETFF
jgi:hypothetical protein